MGGVVVSAFVPLAPTPAGELRPCGSSADGRHLEFFANPVDVDELLASGIVLRRDGVRSRFRVSLSPTPHYVNGDVQIIVRPEEA